MVVAVALGMVLFLVPLAEACPSCKAALNELPGEMAGPQGDPAAGFFWSIMLMISMPFTLVGLFTGFAYREVRKARRLAATPQSESTDNRPITSGRHD